jgi:2-dehydro-3-deoxygluconokinase
MKVVTMGEMMIRLMPTGNLRFEQASSFDVFYGGDESIVAALLARFGIHSVYVTKLPDNPIAQIAINKLREQGVDTSGIVRGGDRIGINFYENGVSMRPSNVVYDRKHSSISEATENDFDFDVLFQEADWFHVAGITPALSDNAALLTEKALASAKAHKVTISVDLNYRSKLWTPEKARSVMIPLMKYVDVCVGNEEDAEKVLGFMPENTNVNSGKLYINGYKNMFEQLWERFGFKIIASTLRESYSASDNGWSALLYDGKEFYHTRKYDIRLVDRGGGGASFAAGLIYGTLNGFNITKTGEFAVATSALKQTIAGDFNLVMLNEVFSLMDGDVSGRVKR